MAFKTKRILKKIVSWSGLFFFAVAAYMIYHQLSKYKLEDIKDANPIVERNPMLEGKNVVAILAPSTK